MNHLLEKNSFEKTLKRKEELINSAIASFRLEGVEVSRETANDIFNKISNELVGSTY